MLTNGLMDSAHAPTDSFDTRCLQVAYLIVFMPYSPQLSFSIQFVTNWGNQVYGYIRFIYEQHEMIDTFYLLTSTELESFEWKFRLVVKHKFSQGF